MVAIDAAGFDRILRSKGHLVQRASILGRIAKTRHTSRCQHHGHLLGLGPPPDSWRAANGRRAPVIPAKRTAATTLRTDLRVRSRD